MGHISYATVTQGIKAATDMSYNTFPEKNLVIIFGKSNAAAPHLHCCKEKRNKSEIKK